MTAKVHCYWFCDWPKVQLPWDKQNFLVKGSVWFRWTRRCSLWGGEKERKWDTDVTEWPMRAAIGGDKDSKREGGMKRRRPCQIWLLWLTPRLQINLSKYRYTLVIIKLLKNNSRDNLETLDDEPCNWSSSLPYSIKVNQNSRTHSIDNDNWYGKWRSRSTEWECECANLLFTKRRLHSPDLIPIWGTGGESSLSKPELSIPASASALPSPLSSTSAASAASCVISTCPSAGCTSGQAPLPRGCGPSLPSQHGGHCRPDQEHLRIEAWELVKKVITFFWKSGLFMMVNVSGAMGPFPISPLTFHTSFTT